MLPQSYKMNMLNSKTIYINPNFRGQLPPTNISVSVHPASSIPKSTHINPLFLESKNHGHTIHMNPAFLEKFKEKQMGLEIQQEKHVPVQHVPHDFTENCLPSEKFASKSPSIFLNDNNSGKIICKSKNRLIREPAHKVLQTSTLFKPPMPLPPLLVLNKRKLIRKSTSVPAVIPIQNCDSSIARITKYRLDNRVIKKKALLPPTPKIKRSSFVGQYALRRSSLNSSTNISSSLKSILSVNKNVNKKLQLLNINGLLYKSTKNSLKLKEVANKNHNTPKNIKPIANKKVEITETIKANQGLTIFVRGTKYVMDANKFKLTRVTNIDNSLSKADVNKKPNTPTCKRIDIGGYTFITVNSSKNILVRTTNHLSRAYVHNAKQKSLQFLTKHLVKSNIPCPIYQRVGKCAAFERGKCSKVHNKHQVAICTKFLRGECLNSKCLLSHSVSLSKMPVCKFYLQGVCVRNDCPYLHKKLSDKAELCTEFLRGFCQLADKCNKRHEFVCPEIVKNNKCTTRNCVYCNDKRRKELQSERKMEKIKNKSTIINTNSNSSKNPIENENPCTRYFIESCSETCESQDGYNNTTISDCNVNDSYTETSGDDVKILMKNRPKLGTLPSYIPL